MAEVAASLPWEDNFQTSVTQLAYSHLSLGGEGGVQLEELFCLLRKVDRNVELSIKQLFLQRKDVLLGIHLQIVLEAWR